MWSQKSTGINTVYSVSSPWPNAFAALKYSLSRASLLVRTSYPSKVLRNPELPSQMGRMLESVFKVRLSFVAEGTDRYIGKR